MNQNELHGLYLNLEDLKKMVESPTVKMPKFNTREEKLKWIKEHLNDVVQKKKDT